MTYTLHRAELEDLPQMISWEVELFGADAWSPELMIHEVSHPDHYYLVAREEGSSDIVGYAGLAADPRPGGHADIQTIAVIPDHRGTGLGRRLLHALLERANEGAVATVFLEVRADNQPAISLYRSEGFEDIDRRIGYYQPDGVDALVMTKQLRAPETGWAVGRE
jgi:ribosomal-protein-alanine N-acetyltransferase